MRGVAVVKIGGSILSGPHAYRRAAAYIAERICAAPDEGIVAVVSARSGVTDSLLATAKDIVEDPAPGTLDLLWSTGELASAALLALTLQARGVNAAALNVHQTGLHVADAGDAPGHSRVSPLRLLTQLAQHDVVVAPGFLARGPADAVVSLGRGGSDLTAVLLAAGLGAARCELLKDVPGYFTADPKRDPCARPIQALSYARAIEMADNGCALVQRHALEAAYRHNLPVIVAAMDHPHRTFIN